MHAALIARSKRLRSDTHAFLAGILAGASPEEVDMCQVVLEVAGYGTLAAVACVTAAALEALEGIKPAHAGLLQRALANHGEFQRRADAAAAAARSPGPTARDAAVVVASGDGERSAPPPPSDTAAAIEAAAADPGPSVVVVEQFIAERTEIVEEAAAAPGPPGGPPRSSGVAEEGTHEVKPGTAAGIPKNAVVC